MVTSFSRGHKIYYSVEDKIWKYADSNETDCGLRPCVKCHELPTPAGYDPCIGYIDGATAVCCGHGVEDGYVKWD